MELLLATDFLGKAIWMWLVFVGVVFVLLVLDLGLLHKDQNEIGVKESLLLSSFTSRSRFWRLDLV